MVNVFIVHSGKDYDYVKDTVEPFLMGLEDENGKPANRGGSANILTLESGENSSRNKDAWKKDARKLIKMAQVVIVVIGDDSTDFEKAQTMGWEIDQAVKFNKQIMILNPADFDIPSYLYKPDRFTQQNQPIAPQMELSQIKERIDNFARGYYNIFSSRYQRMDDDAKVSRKNELMDQYKLFQKSSEDLVARRQSVNSFYLSVNSALVALVGIVMGVVAMPAKLWVILFMSLTGIIMDISWINILDAYGTLNAAKMKVINLMEEQLPVALYDAEWRVMSDKLNNKRYVSFTDSEKRIPRIFAALHTVIIIGVAAYTLITLIMH